MANPYTSYDLAHLASNLSEVLSNYSIVSITNKAGAIVYANDNFCQISKFPREELLGQDHSLIKSGHHDNDFFKEMWETILSGDTWHGEICNKASDNSLYWVNTHIVPIKSPDGEDYFIAINLDITSVKEAEGINKKNQKQLLLADKMASLGILTSGVAHEINNPNHLIMSNNELLEKVWKDALAILDDHYQEQGDFNLAGIPFSEMKEQIPLMTQRIQGGTERIKNIVENFKKFAREEDESLSDTFNLNVVVKSSLTLVGNLLRKSTYNFHLELEDGIPDIIGSFQQLEQVLINFLTNSCQALTSMQQGIMVKTRYNKDNNTVQLIVKDEGSGIPPDIKKKIMDPFFTTKRSSGGTGLGLFISYGIIQRHNGRITFTSKESVGCTVKVSLPIAPPSR
ncbi:MAG: PAS domain-containing protein [Planctomycetes bacterium]|nr:PAS domain-containing protein [Planctomycetota bacterium]